MANNTPVVIERKKVRNPAFDYELLRKEAIAHIQALSGNIWTDYNLHDPGVTILEQLCYAITDLAYRTDFPIDEILADKKGDIDTLLHAFFSKAAILSTAPVTINDYRKLVLDEVDAVENIWIEPVKALQPHGCTKGVYRIFLQMEDALTDGATTSAEATQRMVDAVQSCLRSYRNIGEDVEEIIVLQPQELFIKAEIMVDSRYDSREIMAKICHAFESVLHPPVRFFTEAELVYMGYAVEDIYAGPLLKNGFIIDSDLSEREKLIDPADLVKAVSQVEGVIKVKGLYIAGEDGNYTARSLALKEGYYPFLQLTSDKNDIKIISDKYEYSIKEVAFWDLYRKMKIVAKRKFVGQLTGDAHPPLKAAYRNVGWYYSLQHHFPGIYGIGEHGLDADVPELRKAQAKQLKAYLLFFEQLLANYLAQLENMGNFFSPLTGNTTAYTYAVQPLYAVPHVQPLLKAFTENTPHNARSWEQFMADTGNGYMKALQSAPETDKVYQERKNRVLDHLLARFNLSLIKYPVALSVHLYNAHQPAARISPELQWKSDILRNVAKLTANRIRAFNYREDVFTTGALSGYEKWLYKLLYIPAEKRKRLSAVFDAEHLQVAVSKSRRPVQPGTVKEYQVKEELLKVVVEEPLQTSTAAEPSLKYDFGSQPVSFLGKGLNAANYRIIFEEERREYLVLYSQAHQEVWKEVIKSATRAGAIQALKDMIGYLEQLNRDSEGFYLVEHLLLKPKYQERRFGYRMYSRDGKILKEHPYWCTFDEREQQLQQLQEEAVQQQAHFEYYIKQEYGKMLREDFFRFGLTVVFPSWPARFQLREFRDFAEELIREHTPVQFRIQYKWLGIGAMRAFEEPYFKWLQALREKEDGQAAAAALINSLAADSYFDK